MVHTFRCLDRCFALDTESGSVFAVSELTKQLIDNRIFPEGKPSGGISYSAGEIAEANAEIDALIAEGILFSPAPDIKQPDIKQSEVVKSLCINVSHCCNLACAYCFAGGGTYNSQPAHMPFEVAKAAIDFLIARSGGRHTLEADFFGGEPLLNLDVIKQTVAYARSKEKETGKKFRFTVTTNAVSLTDDAIDYFNDEMYNVVISIDGREDVHNAVRKDAAGRDTYRKALDNALRFRQKRGDKLYYIRGTFTAKSPDFANDVLALNDAGFDQISIEPVVLPDDHPLALRDEQLEMLKEQYEILAAEYLKRRKTGKWFSFFHFNIDLSGGPCLKKRLQGCGAGGEYLAVAPDGSLYPCHRFDGKPDYRMGSVLDNTLDQSISAVFRTSNLNTKPHCRDCFCKYFCSGGCAANSIEYGGGINSPYAFSCELMKKRTEAAIAIAVIERE